MGSRRPILPRRTPPNFDMKSIALLMVAAAMWSQVACRPQFGLGGSSSTVQQQPGQANSVQQGNAAANMGGAMASGSNIQNVQGGGSAQGSTNSGATGGLQGFTAGVNNMGTTNSQPGSMSSTQMQPMAFPSFPQFPQPIAVGK